MQFEWNEILITLIPNIRDTYLTTAYEAIHRPQKAKPSS